MTNQPNETDPAVTGEGDDGYFEEDYNVPGMLNDPDIIFRKPGVK
jgi:hypothetical protein